MFNEQKINDNGEIRTIIYASDLKPILLKEEIDTIKVYDRENNRVKIFRLVEEREIVQGET